MTSENRTQGPAWSLILPAGKDRAPGTQISGAEVQVSSSNSPHEPCAAFSSDDPAGPIQTAGIWRADNAAQLRGLLDLRDTDSLDVLVARAWEEWGTGLAEQLAGPFALCIYDASSESFYCARDALGVEPLFLARSPRRMAASHCPRSARRAAQLASVPDPRMIADFVTGQITSTAATFHENLERIPPGHWRLIAPGQDVSERYWSLNAVAESAPEKDPATLLRSGLAHEIAAGGGLGDDLAVLLSGGLDSSAIAALTADMRPETRDVATLSLTYDGKKGWVDGPYIADMRAALAMDHHSLPSADHDPFADIDAVIYALDGPCFGYGVSVSTSLFAYAKTCRAGTVLHGHGGDEIISYGTGRLNELAREGRWRDLWREAKGAAALSSQPKWQVFKRYLVHRPKYRWLMQRWSKVFARALPQREENQEPDILAEALKPFKDAPTGDLRPLQTRPEHTERDLHIAALEHPVQPHALETIVLTGRHYGLKIAMPFMARQLAELCVSLPSHWKLRGGYTRFILREAIRPLVPASVAGRRDKNDFTQGFIEGLVASPFARQYADPDNAALTRYVNARWLAENWAKVDHLGTDISIATARGLWRAAVLGRWLGIDRDAGILESDGGQALPK